MKRAESVAKAIRARGLRCVSFDMDQTLVGKHSRGALLRQEFADFGSHVKPDFIALATALDKCGVFLAVSTHSDRMERPRMSPVPYLLGEDLVAPILSFALGPVEPSGLGNP